MTDTKSLELFADFLEKFSPEQMAEFEKYIKDRNKQSIDSAALTASDAEMTFGNSHNLARQYDSLQSGSAEDVHALIEDMPIAIDDTREYDVLPTENFLDEEQEGVQYQEIDNEDEKAIVPTKDKYGRVYSDKFVVMQKRMIHAISRLDLNERRLVLMLATLVRGAVEANPRQKVFRISAADFGDFYGLSRSKRYEFLKGVSKSLHGKVFYFWNFETDGRLVPSAKSQSKNGRMSKGTEVAISWVGKAEYRAGEGCVDIHLLDDVIEMLCIFDQMNPYTKYQKDWITKLGGYGIVLLGLVLSATKETRRHVKEYQGDVGPMDVYYTLKYLREKFDCTNRYEKTHDFKRYVIDAGIKDIQKHTPLRIRVDYDLSGRSVIGAWFGVDNADEPKPKVAKKDEWKHFKMTSAQLDMFADKIAQIEGLDAQDVKRVLEHPLEQQKYVEMLKRLNYKPSGWFAKSVVDKFVKEAQEQTKAEAIIQAEKQALESAWKAWKVTASDEEIEMLSDKAYSYITANFEKIKWQHANTPQIRLHMFEQYFRKAFES
ncbi:hypothetical protein B0181_11415 [Moraxella caviae]|uniref:Replication protein n=1 Tax=Moraxella caviae TaxID=34060 RepID=A0A1S9ZTI5_9GAMM|nr:RepB family plasmid replication initiator protein [Moraxella caviae]OOR86816.1 hypothetical protein B0181_11415 [Moraxella caviae]STZ13602.1 replication protein [Moraxella caviae]VEW13308.1 replication protein [Moraxella caviae]